MRKRLLSGLLALCLIFSLLPVSALADDAATSGTCGDNLTWTLKDGTLTISGEGEMEFEDMAPWSDELDSIVNVVIEDGVTSIEQYTFEDCDLLASVTIPDSVQSIGACAFENCWSLEQVHYLGTIEQWGEVYVEHRNDNLRYATVNCKDGVAPKLYYCGSSVTWTNEDGVLTISGSGNMYDYYTNSSIPWNGSAESITKVVVKDGVTCIGEWAFLDCENLKSIELPKSIESINYNAFDGCTSLTDVEYAGTSLQWKRIDISGGNEALGGATIHCSDMDISHDTSWSFEENTLTISGKGDMDDYGWNGAPWYDEIDNIWSAVIKDGVTGIGACAFADCGNLETITIPASVQSIGGYAFYECYSLKKVNYSGTVEQWGEILIDDHNGALSNATIHCSDGDIIPPFECGDDVTATLEDGVLTITGNGGMYDYDYGAPWDNQADSVKSVVVRTGVTRIGYRAFYNCNNLETLTLPTSVVTIRSEAFSESSELTDVNYAGTSAQWKEIEVGENNYALYSATIHCTDKDLSYSTAWTLEDGVLTISGTGDMLDYTWESPAPWQDQIKSIVRIIIEDGVTRIGNNAFPSSNVESITLPASVESIGYHAIYACRTLKDIYYSGTKAQWDEITISDMFITKCQATIHCKDGDILTSSYCGDNVNWTLDENGVLTVYGTGDMYNYEEGCYAPWENQTESVTSIVIENGVTSIGALAFYDCKNAKSVSIPDSVKIIRSMAFYWCSGLESITIPGSVETINTLAFCCCKGLKNVVLPEGLKTLDGRGVFSDCESLESVTIPSTLEDFSEDSQFYNCPNFKTIIVSENSDIFSSDDGILFSKDKSKIVLYPEGREATEYQIPNSVRTISYHAFLGCKNLQNVEIPDSVKEIRQSAFFECTGIKNVVIPDGVERIENRAFYECSSLESITIPASMTSVGRYAFSYCDALKDVYYDGFESQWRDIYYGDDLDDVTIHFKDPMEIQASGTCGDDLTWTLEKCTLTISGNGDMKNYYSWDTPWFEYKDAIFSIVIEDGVTSISGDAFYQCYKLESVSVSGTVKSIESGTFEDCNNLKSVSLTNGLESIDEYAFANCTSLTTITIPASVINLHEEAFRSCEALSAIDVDENNSMYCSVDGVLFNKSKTILITYPNGKETADYHIPNGVTEIGDYAFEENMHLASVVIPDSVTKLGYAAFMYCEGLEKVTLSKNITEFDSYVFKDCMSLKTLVIPDGVTSIGYYSLSGCTSLESVVIPESVTFISEGAFYDCSALADVYYKGSEEQWNQIDVDYDDNNYRLEEATIHYNYTDGHIHSYTAVVTEPTCTEEGYTTYTCACGDSYIDNYTDALGHDTVYHEAKSATCTEKGWNEYFTCIRCDFTTYEEIAPTGHSYVAKVFAPTCTVKGYTTYTCTVCGDSYSDNYTDALGHDRIHHEAKAATCTEIGWDAYDTCSRCDYTSYKEIAALGHDISYSVTKAPTCTEKGTETGKCSRCDVTETRDIDALGHDLVHHDGKAATCTANGWAAYDTCNRCDYTTYKEIAATGHDYNAVVTEPTCTEKGYTTHTCAACGDSYIDTYTDALGHDYGAWKQTKAPTCTEKGEETRTCARCNTTETREVASLGHNYKAVVTAPTCTAKGYTTHTCAACGDSYVDSYTDALGHNYGAWKQTKAPTCTAKGTETRTCTRCNASETRDVASLGHDIKHHAAKAATCTENSWAAYDTCNRCSYSTYKEIAALGHNYKTGKCTRCGAADPNYIVAPELKITTSAGKPKISWNAVDGAVKYWVYRSTDGKTYNYYDSTTKMSYTNNSTTIGTTYYYKVKAVKVVDGNNYASDFSVSKSIQCKPAAPTVSINRSNGKPKLSWKAVSGATKYWIYRSTDGVNFKYWDSTTKTSYTNSGAESGKKYYYRVKAVADVNGKNIVSANSSTKSLFTSLAKPSVSITTSNGKPKLTWKAVTGADKYYIYRSTDGKNFSYWDSTTKTTYVNSGAKKNTKYYYKVKAVCASNSYANSAQSSTVSIKATK